MDNKYVFLTEIEEPWAQMLMEMLEKNGIASVGFSVHGAGLVTMTGVREKRKVHVPAERLEAAEDILRAFFTQQASQEE